MSHALAVQTQSVKSSASSSDNWVTPRLIMGCVANLWECGGYHDPCPAYWDGVTDGLTHRWCDRNWVNPQFSRVAEWADKALYEAKEGGNSVLFLGASRTSARWYGKLWDASDVAILLRKRVKFLDPATMQEVGSAPFDVTIFGLNVSPRLARGCFEGIGRVVTL